MKITVIGTGYVGLVSGVCFSDLGHQVACVDVDMTKIAALRNGNIPIYEPGLEEMVARNADAGRLSFTTDLSSAVADSDIVMIAVGTPPRPEDGHADLSYVHAAAAEIGKALTGYTVVVTKSTVPVGTGDEIERIIRGVNPLADFSIVSNPEFLREGSAIGDFKEPDRIVIGIHDVRARPFMEELYLPLSSASILYVSRCTAELTKYAGNAFLAMKIAFINEIADLCERTGADVDEVAKGIGMDSRIGSKFLAAGPGYGGSCFPKDTMALARIGQQNNAPMSLVEATIRSNERRKVSMARKVLDAAGGSVAGKDIAFLGLTFKAGTDDMRDAPSRDIIAILQEHGARIRAYDPQGMENAQACLNDVVYANTAMEAVAEADAVVLVTEWPEFRMLDLAEVALSLRSPTIIDLRNMLSSEVMSAQGLDHYPVGKQPVLASTPSMALSA